MKQHWEILEQQGKCHGNYNIEERLENFQLQNSMIMIILEEEEVVNKKLN